MRLPGASLIARAERTASEIKVPLTENLRLSRLVWQTYRQADEDALNIHAASLAYHSLFATFLLLVFLISLLGVFHASDFVGTMLDRVSLAMPAPVSALIREQLPKSTEGDPARTAFTIGAVISILGALWGVSTAFRTVMQATNVIYKVREGRPVWKIYAIAVLLSLAVTVLLLAAAALVVAGEAIGIRIAEVVGLGEVFRFVWSIAQWPIFVLCVLMAFALVYYYAPDVQQEFRFITPGSVVGVGLWLVFTLLFLGFVNIFGVYNRVYGAIAGVAIHMLYMYYFSYFLLLGAELNQVIEQHSPGGKCAGEKVPPGG